MRRIPFSIPMRVQVLTVTQRDGWLVEGPEGWGEYSPLASWSEAEKLQAEKSANEAATVAFPKPLRDAVDINFMVPRIDPEVAAKMARESGCTTIKIKVGDDDSIARIRTIRDLLGSDVHIRLDTNGTWDIETALRMLKQLAQFNIQYVEDPVGNKDNPEQAMRDLAELRRLLQREHIDILIAAEMCVRTVADAKLLRRLDPADVLVLKPQRIGGIAATLQAAEEAGIPTVSSSALETSIGLSQVLAVAAALPESPYAHGIGTASLLASDVVAESDRLIPVKSILRPGRVAPSPEWLAAQSQIPASV